MPIAKIRLQKTAMSTKQHYKYI